METIVIEAGAVLFAMCGMQCCSYMNTAVVSVFHCFSQSIVY